MFGLGSRLPRMQTNAIATIDVMADGRRVRAAVRDNGVDVPVLFQAFHYGEYDAPGIDWGSVRTVVDAGANIGLASLLFASRAPRARVVAIEPESRNVSLLRLNFELNAIDGVVVEKALWPTTTRLSFGIQGSSVSHAVVTDPKGDGHVEVTTIAPKSLFEIVGRDEIDLMKIDVEGAETQIFSAPDLAEWAPRVRYFLLECHSHFGFGASPNDIERALSPLGFRVVTYDVGKGLVAAIRR